MNKEYWLDLLQKAGWAGLYGAIAAFAAFQNLGPETLVAAGVCAAARGATVFLTTIGDAIKEDYGLVTDRGMKKVTWKNNL